MIEGVHRLRLLELVNEARRQWRFRKKRADQNKRVQLVEAGLNSFIYQPVSETPHLAEAWTLTERLLAELDEKAREDGARFMVASIPSSIQTHPDTQYRKAVTAKLGVDDLLFPERQLASFGEKGGYPAFPMVEELQAAVDGSHFHGFDNTVYGFGHLNPLGHQELADRLAPRVCDELKTEKESAGLDEGLAAIDRGRPALRLSSRPQ
jgi:hypothetical protein